MIEIIIGLTCAIALFSYRIVQECRKKIDHSKRWDYED